jgi:acetoacetate decarboxylase
MRKICDVLTAKGTAMKEAEVLERAFAMPLTSPAFPRGPYRFCQREYLIIEYRTHFEKLKAFGAGAARGP